MSIPSVADALAIVTVGNAVASIIVPVPLADVLAVLVEVTFPVKVNVSVPSLMLSIKVETGTTMLVDPAGIVTVVLIVT